MAGGTICFTEKGFTVRVPELRSSTTLAVTRCEKHGKGVLCLDNAFSLIEGHPIESQALRVCHPPRFIYCLRSKLESSRMVPREKQKIEIEKTHGSLIFVQSSS